MAHASLSQTQQQRLQMALAPQLRQSLELLQVPIMELRTLVQQELEQNPTLEEKLTANEQIEVEPGSNEAEEAGEMNFDEEFAVLAQLDDEWREYFQQNQVIHRPTQDEEAKRRHFINSISQAESLQEHLIHQLALSNLSDEDRRIGEVLIGNINEDGYLSITLEELAETRKYELGRLERILETIRDFDPIGVGSRDLPECLLQQLKRIGMEQDLAARIIRDHLEDLGAHKYQQIARALKVSVEQIQKSANVIATLEPKPGRQFGTDTAPYVVPEVQVQRMNEHFAVFLNDEQIPRLRISKQYRRLMEDPDTPDEVKEYIREKVRSGTFLIKSIGQRQHTIRSIANEILQAQHDFFEMGIAHLKPLTMAEIARILGIHETTVSRAIANKYMQTPQGTFEMKYFFTPGFRNADGNEVSNKTIKDAIARLIDQEDSSAPLSDQAIAARLKEEGFNIARRTIAKYREELKILPSHLRKRV